MTEKQQTRDKTRYRCAHFCDLLSGFNDLKLDLQLFAIQELPLVGGAAGSVSSI